MRHRCARFTSSPASACSPAARRSSARTSIGRRRPPARIRGKSRGRRRARTIFRPTRAIAERADTRARPTRYARAAAVRATAILACSRVAFRAWTWRRARRIAERATIAVRPANPASRVRASRRRARRTRAPPTAASRSAPAPLANVAWTGRVFAMQNPVRAAAAPPGSASLAAHGARAATVEGRARRASRRTSATRRRASPPRWDVATRAEAAPAPARTSATLMDGPARQAASTTRLWWGPRSTCPTAAICAR
jgi:hypothetical protein